MPFKHLARPLSRFLGRAPQGARAAPPERVPAGAATGPTAAVCESTDGPTLARLAGIRRGAEPAMPPSSLQPARQRLAELIDAGGVDFEELCADADDVVSLLCVASLCSEPVRLARTFDLITDPAVRAGLVLNGASSRIRQAAAQSISDPDELRRLVRRLRGKDKSVYRIVREKCDALNAELQRANKIRDEALAACESLERHSHRIHDAIYEPTFRHFQSRWAAVATHADAHIVERADGALRRCEEIIAEHRRRLARDASEKAEREAREAAREQARLRAEIESARLRDEAAREATELAARREAEMKASADRAAAHALALHEIGALIGKTHHALRDGGTGRASGLRRALEQKLATLPHLPSSLVRQMQQLDATLGELKDWKEHAAAPKRAALVEDMQALIGAPLEPRVLAERIHRLQEDWKTVSKGVASDSQADWQRFHQAAQSAYQPCREHFESEARVRQANAAARRSILDRLRAFEAEHGGEDTDFGAVATVLREAPQEWRRHFPVDRAQDRILQREFAVVIERLGNRLDGWYAQNAAKKQILIQEAAQILAHESGREATESVKRLQARWTEIGSAAREQERALWEEFRRHCDAVFQKRQQAQAEHTASLQTNRMRARALCEDAESLARQSDTTLLEGTSRLSDLRVAFETLGELPRDAERALKSRFERALDQVRGAVSRQRAAEKRRALLDLLESARLIHAYGWALHGEAAEAERAALKRQAETFIAGVARWPDGAEEALDAAWAAAGAAAPAESESRLRILCIRHELGADLPTPPEDLALRRDHQMHLLVERMGQGREATREDFESLTREWVRIGGVAPERYDALLGRFQRVARHGL